MAQRVLIPPPVWPDPAAAAAEPTNEEIAAAIGAPSGPPGDLPPLARPEYDELPPVRIPTARAPTGDDVTAMLAEALRRLGFVVTPEPTEAPQVAAIDGLLIRDTSAHTPATDPSKVLYIDMNVYEGVTLHMVNNLDQTVGITPYGNAGKLISGGVAFDAGAISIAAGASDAITILPEASGWLPWLYLSAVCAVQPAAGALTVRAVKFRRMRV